MRHKKHNNQPDLITKLRRWLIDPFIDDIPEVDLPEGQAMAVISVGDTGVGIKPDDLPHIFQPFYHVTEEKKGA